MNTYLISLIPLISALFVFALGIIVFFRKKVTTLNLIFFFITIAVGNWLFGTFKMFRSTAGESAIFWDRFIYGSVVFIPALFYHFGVVFTQKIREKLQRSCVVLGYLLSIFFLILSRTDYFVSGLFRYKWGVHTKARLFHHVFLIYFSIYLILFIINLYRYYKKSAGPIKKNQSYYIFLAFFILILIGPLGYLPAYEIPILPFPFLSGLFFVTILAYAITRYRLFDIRVVVRRGTVYGLSLGVAGGLGVLLVWLVSRYLGEKITGLLLLVDSVAILLSISVFFPIKSFFEKLANKYLFASLYDTRRKIEELTQALPKIFYLDDIVNLIYKTINETLHIERFGVIVKEPGEENLIVLKKKPDSLVISPFKESLFYFLKKLKQTILLQEIEIILLSPEEKEKLKKILSKSKISMVLYLVSKGEIYGMILLGEKASGDAFTVQDIRLLENLALQASISIENGLLFRKTQRFAEELKIKVAQATKDLRAANAELKRLDQAKSEFLRIVSHQLRTPMTILRWYAKALLRGDYGKLNKKQLEVANDIYQATLRQIKLIGSFLDVAHIEAGKITVRKEKGNIEELVNDVVSELKVLAEKMGIYLKVEKPKKEVPEFYFDYEKTREVLRNIVDNAIKYIEKGGATVGFKYDEKKKEVLVYVKDTGIGFSPEEKKKLFMKFSRLRNNKVNPWGSGLGLYICKRLIEVQGGKIWAESPGKGKGSTFYFTLPVKDN